jgi:hypothetical protein
MKKVHIIGGGTVSYIRSHLALSAPAYGKTAKLIEGLCKGYSGNMEVITHLTRMAGGADNLETNEDVLKLLETLKQDSDTKIIFMNASLCDFHASLDGVRGKKEKRLQTRNKSEWKSPLRLHPAEKIIGKIRDTRKDIFLVGFKQTFNSSLDEQYIAGLNLLKESSCNLVLANDTGTRMNMVITPEEARYHVTQDRYEAIKGLVEMAYLRSHLTFTRSTVVAGESVAWDSALVPTSLRAVVNHCIERGAYKPFRGATVGHFAVKVDDNTFLTSKRKTNFNDLESVGLVMVKTDGPDSVIAFGSKPSVGGQSQRIVFHEHRDYDCIVHFHCPIKENSLVPQVSQREYECGSHECGMNTSRGLKKFNNLSAVYLKEHGPNIVFNRSIDPQEVIDFIEWNFDLSGKTGGAVSVSQTSNNAIDYLVNYAKREML